MMFKIAKRQSYQIITILVLAIALPANGFYFSIFPNYQTCFNSTVYLNQQLLIQADSPILQANHQAIIKVYKTDGLVQETKMNDSNLKLTVGKTEKVIQDSDHEKQHSFQYSTCVIIKNKLASQNNQQKRVQYIFSLTISTNFDHILRKKADQKIDPKRNQNLDKIDELAVKILELGQQQIELHQSYLVKQRQTDNLIMYLKEKIHIYAIFECLMVMASAFLNVYLLRKFLVDSNLI